MKSYRLNTLFLLAGIGCLWQTLQCYKLKCIGGWTAACIAVGILALLHHLVRRWHY